MQALSKKKTGDICTIKWMFGIPPENKRWIDPWHGWKTDCNV